MRYSIHQLPFWAFLLIQIISFILIILLNAINLSNTFFLILLIIIELIVLSFGLQFFLFKKKTKKYFYYSWEIQFFLYFLFLIIFFPQNFFVVEEVSIVTSAFFAIGLIGVEILILSYIILNEKAVQKIFLILASSTTIIVFLIVFFVFKEGIPAFIENDPVEFLTGTEWQPFYEDDYSEYVTLTASFIPSDFIIYSDNNIVVIPPSSSKNIMIYIDNYASINDTYSISIESSLKTSFEKNEITVNSDSSNSFNLTINSEEIGEETVLVKAVSKSTNVEKKYELIVKTADSGVVVNPDFVEVYLSADEENKPIGFTIINGGNEAETFIFTIDCSDTFRPNCRNVNWDYSTNSGELTIDGFESTKIDLIPRLVEKIDGMYNLSLNVKSKDNPSISFTSDIVIHYTRNSLLSAIDTDHEVILGQTGFFNVSIDEYSLGQDLNLSVEIVKGNGIVKVLHGNKTILTGEGNVGLDFTTNTDNYFSITVDSIDNEIEELVVKISAYRQGTKPIVGILPFIVATLISTIVAVCIAAPLGLGCAVFLAEYVPDRIRKFLRPLYELLAGIPSVLYGLWGFATFGPLIAEYIYPLLSNTLGQHIGLFEPNNNMDRGILTASIVLSIMILPIVITLSEDAIRSVRRSLKEGSLALGATRWQTMRRVIIPKAKSGIVTSIILGTGRAIGETMAVLMIMGLTINLPKSLFDPGVTMTGVIAGFFESTFTYDYTRHALFGIGTVLFLMVFTLNILISRLQGKDEENSKKPSIFNFIFGKIYDKINNITENKKLTDISVKKITDKITPSKIFNHNKFIILDVNTNSQNNKTKIYNEKILENTKKNLRNEKLILILLIFAAGLVSFFLFYILGDIIVNGGLSLKPEFFLQREIKGGQQGGYLNAIMGSVFLVLIGIGISAPLSIGSAIYVQEYSKKNNLITKIILFTSDTLASTPSIIFGAFGFMFFVLFLDFGYSIIAGGLTLAIMIIPLMLRSSIEAIKAIPRDFQEGSLALGATKWQSIKTVVLPPAMPGIASGVIISMGRAIGETAAVLLTAGYALTVPAGLLQPAASMPNLIFSYYDQAVVWPVLGEKVFSAAFVLILVVLILNAIARIIAVRSARMMKN